MSDGSRAFPPLIANLIEQAAPKGIGYLVRLNFLADEYVGYSVDFVRRADREVVHTVDVTGFMAFLIPIGAPMSPDDLECIAKLERDVAWTRETMVRMATQHRAWCAAGRPRAA